MKMRAGPVTSGNESGDAHCTGPAGVVAVAEAAEGAVGMVACEQAALASMRMVTAKRFMGSSFSCPLPRAWRGEGSAHDASDRRDAGAASRLLKRLGEKMPEIM